MPKKHINRPRTIEELKREGRKASQMAQNDCVVEDIYEKCSNSKLTKELRTGLVFDEGFTSHRCDWDVFHLESPVRYTYIMSRLVHYKLIERCKKIPSRYATGAEILLVHDQEMIETLESISHIDNRNVREKLSSLYDSVYFSKHTYQAAKLAVGSVLNLVEAVVNGEVKNGMAIVRPPGHHAMQNDYCGYCFFNNVAIAAQYALDNLRLKKILIVDWDVHHGQATQQMFYDDDRVLYFSIHRYEHGKFWPNLRESNFDYVGEGKGYGYNINVPLNETGCGDREYLKIFHHILLPVAYEFCPDLVLVSAGYDAVIGCPEGEMIVSPGGYHHMTTNLMGLAGGKVVVCLEGGYFVPTLAESVSQTVMALLGDTAPISLSYYRHKPSVVESIYNVISILRKVWNCFEHFNDEDLTVCADEKDKPKTHVVEAKYLGTIPVPPFPTRDACTPIHPVAGVRASQVLSVLQQNNYKLQHPMVVGYVYDEKMELHVPPEMNSFEKPERLARTIEILKELNLLDRMVPIKCREATDEEIFACHDQDYIDKVKSLGSKSEADLKASEGWSNVYSSEFTMQSARIAAGSLLELMDAVNKDEVSCGVAIIRPPGHHAEEGSASGFCILNNIAIAVKQASRIYTRILIVDWDIHYGNGIQKIFEQYPNIMYLSVHRHDNGKFFPYSYMGSGTTLGKSIGKWSTLNVAWNNGTMSDAEYISCWTRILLPIAYGFKPEIVFIAAGFDACRGDPLGGYNVSPETFGHLVQLLKPLARSRIVIALEGGYNVNSVGYSMAMCVKALLNDPLPPLVLGKISKSAQQSINQTVRVHQERWYPLLRQVIFDESALVPLNQFADSSKMTQTIESIEAAYKKVAEASNAAKKLLAESARSTHFTLSAYTDPTRVILTESKNATEAALIDSTDAAEVSSTESKNAIEVALIESADAAEAPLTESKNATEVTLIESTDAEVPLAESTNEAQVTLSKCTDPAQVTVTDSTDPTQVTSTESTD